MNETLEARLSAVEDRLAIYNLLAAHPLSADTGDREFIEAIYSDDVVFDRGPGLDGARGRENLVAFVERDAHREAIAGGLAHFGNLPLVEIDGDTAMATSYLALIVVDSDGKPRELPNHGVSTGFRIHRVYVNRWTLTRTDERWVIAARTLIPMDGSELAQRVLHKARSYYVRTVPVR
jgi:hypothetical protein